MAETAPTLQDDRQNCWQLACIQGASLGVPDMLIGGVIAIREGGKTAVFSILIGNLILWGVGLTTTAMAAPGRENAIQNVSKYLGRIGSAIAALFLILAFFTWYTLQIGTTVGAAYNVVGLTNNQLRTGAGTGILTALLAIGGIRLIRKINVLLFPILYLLLIYFAYSMADGSSIDWHKPVTLSTGGIISIVAMNLAGFVNLPTFFRHAKSHSHAFSGLSIFVISLIAFQLLALGVGYSTIESIQQLSGWNQWLMTLFLLFSLIGVNIVNIYFASAGWEMILPHRRSPKEYAIVGLLGTLAYAFLQISAPMEFLENVAEHFIASLGVALLFAFLIRIVVRHRPRPREKLVNLVCWLAGGLVGLGLQVERMDDPNRAMVGAVCATAVAFLVAIFVEETVWSVRTVWRE